MGAEHVRGAAPAPHQKRAQLVPHGAGSFAGTLCREADTGVPVPYVLRAVRHSVPVPYVLRAKSVPSIWRTVSVTNHNHIRHLTSYV